MDGQWLESAFGTLCDLAPAEVEAQLQAWECDHQQEVAQLRRMFAARETSQRFDQPLKLAYVPEKPSIEDHEIIEQLGQGGMGTVYLAEQHRPIRRKVALKILHLNLPIHVDKFIEERQTLSRLQHPQIAQVLQAGLDQAGRPWFTMPVLQGLPLTEYCQQHRLSLKQRINLFLQLCEGIHHAHQRRVIHRDLKPSNIITLEVDGQPRVQIIDFGIATSLFSEQPRTQSPFLGSLPYISPEQLQQNPDIDTRSDVFSLGVILYEMLLGLAPFPETQDITPLEYLRVLQTQSAVSTTCRLQQDPAHAAAQAQQMRISPKHLSRLLRGDLNAILMHCLTYEKETRYASVDALMRDLRLFLAHQPVGVRRVRFWERPSYAYRRNPLRAIFIAFLMALIPLSGLLYINHMKAQIKTQQALAYGDAYEDLYRNMMRIWNPLNLGLNAALLRQRLQDLEPLLTRLDAEGSPDTIDLRFVIGSTYKELGDYRKALGHFESALVEAHLRKDVHVWKRLHIMEGLARSWYELGVYEKAQHTFADMRDLASQKLGASSLFGIRAQLGMAMIDLGQGKASKAQEQFDLLLPQLAAQPHTGIMEIQSYAIQQAVALRLLGQPQAAETLLRQSLEQLAPITHDSHPFVISAKFNLASSLIQQNKEVAQTILLLDQVYQARSEFLGEMHPKTLLVKDTLASLAITQGDYQRAFQELQQLLQVDPHLASFLPHDRLQIHARLALVQSYLKLLPQQNIAENLQAAISQAREAGITRSPSYLTALNNLADFYLKLKQPQRALEVIQEAVTSHQQHSAPQNRSRLYAEVTLAEVYQMLGQLEHAKLLYEQSLPKLGREKVLLNHVTTQLKKMAEAGIR